MQIVTKERSPDQQSRAVICPTDKRGLGDVVGCGLAFMGKPDDEGLFDCPGCGIFFNPDTCEAPLQSSLETSERRVKIGTPDKKPPKTAGFLVIARTLLVRNFVAPTGEEVDLVAGDHYLGVIDLDDLKHTMCAPITDNLVEGRSYLFIVSAEVSVAGPSKYPNETASHFSEMINEQAWDELFDVLLAGHQVPVWGRSRTPMLGDAPLIEYAWATHHLGAEWCAETDPETGIDEGWWEFTGPATLMVQ